MTGRPSLEGPELQCVWEAVRLRLERSGKDNRGRVRLAGLSSRGRHLLGALLDRPPQSSVDLGALELALRRLGVGESLPSALEALGHPVSDAPAERRERLRISGDARDAARDEAATWPEPWSRDWMEGVIRAGVLAGLDARAAVLLIQVARALLDRLDEAAASDAGDPLSRVDLAAELLGSSHGLDRGTRAEAAVTRALRHKFPGLKDRDIWERAGAHLDLVSAPVLTWGLRGLNTSPLVGLLDQANSLGIPVHLSQLALRRHPIEVATGSDVLVTENPRIVEAAAQSSSPLTVITLNGNPSGAARLILEQLLSCGAMLRYHGDFDAAGLGICARMHHLGLVPWHMDEAAYLAAIAAADADRAPLPVDPRHSPPTPWDPSLQMAFDRHRRIVHEERLLARLLGPA